MVGRLPASGDDQGAAPALDQQQVGSVAIGAADAVALAAVGLLERAAERAPGHCRSLFQRGLHPAGAGRAQLAHGGNGANDGKWTAAEHTEQPVGFRQQGA